MGVVADTHPCRAPAGKQLPEPGAEIGPGEYGIEGQSDQGENKRELVEMHGQLPSETVGVEAGGSIGAPARRRRTQATPIATPR